MSTRSSAGYSVPTTRKLLRERTSALHEDVDAAFSRFDIATHGGYRELLIAHARVVPGLEARLDAWSDSLPDWPARRRAALLLADLASMGTDACPVDLSPMPAIPSSEAAFGVAYVLEGSRLGGKVLARRLPDEFPRAYLAASQSSQSWPSLMRQLNRSVRTTSQQEAALAAAESAFLAFREAALESVA